MDGKDYTVSSGIVFPPERNMQLCALARIFDDATVFVITGNSYRGKNYETIALSAGAPSTLPKTQH